MQTSSIAPASADEIVFALPIEQRPRLAERLGAAFMRGELTERERCVARAIFACLARDTEVEVRRTLAEQIKCSPLLPNSIARQLAEDVEAVAVPILECSQALSDEDLLAVIAAGNTAKQRAVARRESISEEISDALIETGKKPVIETLLANDGAEISEKTYGSLLEHVAADPEIQELLADRPTLPQQTRERLVHLVTDAVRERLLEEHAFPSDFAEQLIQHGRERALAQALMSVRTPQATEAAAMRLYLNRELTPTLLLRILTGGQLELFGAALATLARVSKDMAQQDLNDCGSDALRQMYRKAGLPDSLQKAFQIVIQRVLEARRVSKGGAWVCPEERIVDDLVRSYHQVSPDGLESALFQLGRLASED